MKQEWSRRKKVVELLEDITRSRPSWRHEHAVKFMEACYGGYSGRGLADWLSKTSGFKRKHSSTQQTSAPVDPAVAAAEHEEQQSARAIIMLRLRSWSP
ncbi:hypothetical protein CF319_g8500 [Tilletia indica]|nr:hypothetical protein CF319_g8500 [Tilletia indica]